MLEFRRKGVYPITEAEGQTGRERHRLQPRRDFCPQPLPRNTSHLILVREKQSAYKITKKMRKTVQPLPSVVE